MLKGALVTAKDSRAGCNIIYSEVNSTSKTEQGFCKNICIVKLQFLILWVLQIYCILYVIFAERLRAFGNLGHSVIKCIQKPSGLPKETIYLPRCIIICKLH